MTPRRDDPRNAFDRELRRAEKERRFMLTALAVGLMAVALVVAGVVALRASGPEAVPGAGAAGGEAAATGDAGAAGGEAASDESAAQSQAAGAQAPAEEAPETAPEPEKAPAPESEPQPEPAPKPAPKPAGPQRLSVGLGQFGYEPSTLTAKAGVPIELTVAQGQGCAAGFLIPGLGISADNTQGPAKVKLPALEAGTYRFYCGMQMVEGKLVVR